MQVPIVQSRSQILPHIRRTAQKSARKLEQISFDVKPNKLVSEPKRNMYKVFCSGDEEQGYATMHCSPDVIVNILEC